MIDGFYIGNFKVYFYGIIIMVGVVAAVFISIRRAVYYGQDVDLIWDIVPWLLIPGLIGARLWHVLTPSESLGFGASYYFEHPLEIINIRNGGLGIPGAVIGGAVGLFIFSRRKGLKFLLWADVIVPGLAIAQAIGRWGNFVNQELYGPPTNLPWAIYIDPAHRMPGYEAYSFFHPMFLYESIWNALNFAFLSLISRKLEARLLNGDIFFLYLVFYAIGRFCLEFIRIDASYVAGINANQVTMAAVAIIIVLVLIIRHKNMVSGDSSDLL